MKFLTRRENVMTQNGPKNVMDGKAQKERTYKAFFDSRIRHQHTEGEKPRSLLTPAQSRQILRTRRACQNRQ